MNSPSLEAVVTIICGTVLALGQAWINMRLRQQDNARDAARVEARERETEAKARDDRAARERQEIHVLVNSNLTAMQERVQDLEHKLGLASGEQIPGPQTITRSSEEPPSDATTIRH
jgi:hypothetical protein